MDANTSDLVRILDFVKHPFGFPSDILIEKKVLTISQDPFCRDVSLASRLP